MSREAFGQELIRAASVHIGKPAVYHWKFAGNCLKPEIEGHCFDGGLGPDVFDCSGLIAKVVSDVSGTDISSWPVNMRHVRDMWRAKGVPLDMMAATVGDVLVEEYVYKNQAMTRPGHIGIIVANEAEEAHWLHASPHAGEVIVSPIPPRTQLLGTIALYP
ncbi:MAG TPA: NlpC/P60 family protein [Candidatus Microsaccharimonas sp.]|nr:NlpC/P60 family protein [Candidatus Microsaccharimonas sp.]